ncbi:MAG: hypothetical protein IJB70_09805 [Clostridia bacterium]|nr:hypothetical protein [Clostridia bacterium]
MKSKNIPIKRNIIKISALCIAAIILTLASVIACNLINAFRLKNAFVKTFNALNESFSVTATDLPIPDVKKSEPFTVSAKTKLSSQSTASISASYKPILKRVSAMAIFRSPKGDIADLYAYCTSKRAGISLSGNSTVFYTLPAQTFKSVAGSVASSVFSDYDEHLTVDKIREILSKLTKKKKVSINKAVITDELLKLYSAIEWDKNTNLNLFKKDPTYTFKIKSHDIGMFLNNISAVNITGYDYIDNIIRENIKKVTADSAKGYYTFNVDIKNSKVTRIDCTTPKMSDSIYKLDISLHDGYEKIKIALSNKTKNSVVFEVEITKNGNVLSISFKGSNNKQVNFSFESGTKPKITAGISVSSNQKIEFESFFANSDYILNLKVKNKNDNKALSLKLSKNYNEFCDVEKSCSIEDAGIADFLSFNMNLKNLKKSVGL